MEYKHQKSDAGGRISAMLNDTEVAHIIYSLNGENMCLEHTVVQPEQRGSGLAKDIMEQAVLVCRVEGWKMVPICSYAVVAMRRNKDWQDVLA